MEHENLLPRDHKSGRELKKKKKRPEEIEEFVGERRGGEWGSSRGKGLASGDQGPTNVTKFSLVTEGLL